MKKIIACMLIALLLCTAALPVAAAEPEPYITSNPTSADYPEGAVAMYTCNAFGNNLTFDWYLVFEGTTYRIADADGSQPWCAYTINTGITAKLSSFCKSFYDFVNLMLCHFRTDNIVSPTRWLWAWRS